MSLSSIRILYNHTPVQALNSLMWLGELLLISLGTEVVVCTARYVLMRDTTCTPRVAVCAPAIPHSMMVVQSTVINPETN